MQSLATVVDASQRFVANIISKNGRNEIQIYPVEQIVQAGDERAQANLAVKIELEAEERIVKVRWVQDIDSFIGKKKGGRKRSADENDADNEYESSPSIYLLAILENSNIICMSPNSNQILTTIENGDENDKIYDLMSCNSSTIWTAGQNGTLREVVISTGKAKKELHLTSVDEQVRHIAYIKKNARQKLFLLGSSTLYLVDPSKKKPIVDTYASLSAQITNIVESIVHPDQVYVTRQNSPNVEVFQITPTNIALLHTVVINSSGSDTDIRICPVQDKEKELLLVLSSQGVEVFSVTKEANEIQPLNTISTDVTTCPLVTIVPEVDNSKSYLGLWYDVNEPQFTKFETDFTTDVKLEIIQNNSHTVDAANNGSTVFVPESAKIQNLDSGSLFAQLQNLLVLEQNDEVDAQVVDLCATNDDEERIKEIIKALASSPETAALATKLFVIISGAVVVDSARGNSLSIWLKWILLANGGHIAKQPEQYETIKALQQGLSDGMKMLPRLLALQGRLQLLKAQADLRSKVGTHEDEVDMSLLSGDNEVEQRDEDTMLFANGEDDDDDEYADDSDGTDGKKIEVSDIED